MNYFTLLRMCLNISNAFYNRYTLNVCHKLICMPDNITYTYIMHPRVHIEIIPADNTDKTYRCTHARRVSLCTRMYANHVIRQVAKHGVMRGHVSLVK